MGELRLNNKIETLTNKQFAKIYTKTDLTDSTNLTYLKEKH